MKIFIANIPNKLEEAELKQMLTQYGQVASVKLVTDKEKGKRKGFGFVEMPVGDQALIAIDGLNGKMIYGREIALSQAEEKEQRVDNNHGQATGSKRPRINKNSDNPDGGEIDGNHW
jgi:RNA recognition motif-containing protein